MSLMPAFLAKFTMAIAKADSVDDVLPVKFGLGIAGVLTGMEFFWIMRLEEVSWFIEDTGRLRFNVART